MPAENLTLWFGFVPCCNVCRAFTMEKVLENPPGKETILLATQYLTDYVMNPLSSPVWE